MTIGWSDQDIQDQGVTDILCEWCTRWYSRTVLLMVQVRAAELIGRRLGVIKG